jgi:hypothetical protein
VMGAAAMAAGNPKVTDWFTKYSEIRHRAQMTPAEKEKSGQMMVQGVLGSDEDKAASQALLKKMVERYTKALSEMDALTPPAETKKLHLGYKQYFGDARSIFSDYLKVQGNLFATDSNGNSIMGQIQQRKAALEALDVTNKDLDAQLRKKYSIPAYPY